MCRTEQAIVVNIARADRYEKYEEQRTDKDNRSCFDHRYCKPSMHCYGSVFIILLYLHHMQRLLARFATYIVGDLAIIVRAAKQNRTIILLNIRARPSIYFYFYRSYENEVFHYFIRIFHFRCPVREISYSAVLRSQIEMILF